MDYKSSYWIVKESIDVQNDLDEFVRYLLIDKKNEQAAIAVLNDYDDTLNELSKVAGSLKLLDDEEMARLGYRKIRFQRHRYYLVYKIIESNAIVLRMFHELQDVDNILA